MTFREKIRALLTELRRGSPRRFSVEPPPQPEQGDYATNIVVGDPGAAGTAAELKRRGTDFISDAEIAGPGFINIRISDAALSAELIEVLTHPDALGRSTVGAGKTVRVEYFQLNIAKRPHIGHLRSAVIGDSIKRMLLAFGYNAVSDTHVGDWGTQFGILLLAYKGLGPVEVSGDPFDTLEEIYLAENTRIAAEPARRELAKEEFAKLERGDPENRKIWQWMVDISMRKLEATAARIGLLAFDEHCPESFYEDKMADIVALALEKGIAKKTADGAVVVDLTADGLDEAVLIKSDGASTYLLRDLATIRYMKATTAFTENLYIVDVRQSHHFRQLFRVAELLGFEGVGELKHLEFGFMTSPEGALSTRKGTAISLDQVLDEARDRARKVIAEKNPNLADLEAIAEAVGVGALKYFDLSHHRRSDYVFRWDDALAFEGNTGPYLQYTHARLRSIMRKSGGEIKKWENKKLELDAVEHRLLAAMLRLPEAIEDALADYTPNTLANYLYTLAKLANEFYHSHPVMQEPDQIKRQFRLALVEGLALTLQNGLDLLGIQAPEEM